MAEDSKTKQDVQYVEESSTQHVDPERELQEKRLVRKVDLMLLPCVWVMYLLSYMDVIIVDPL